MYFLVLLFLKTDTNDWVEADMSESNISLLFQNSGTLYIINEDEQLGFRLFIDRDTGEIRRPERQNLIYEITEDGELGSRVQDFREATKTFDELREDGWDLPWEDDSVVSFTQDEDNLVVINNGEDTVTVPDPLEDPITPTPEPVPAPTPIQGEDSTPVSDEPPTLPVIPDVDGQVYNNDWEPFKKTATLTGNFDLQFWRSTHSDLVDEKTFSGGSLSFNESPFTIDASVYSNHYNVGAYINEDQPWYNWEIPPEDSLVSLGTLVYYNKELEDDFGRSAPNHGANFGLNLSDPVEANYNSNFYIDIINSRDGSENINIGFRGSSRTANRLQLSFDDGRPAPIFLDYLGARPVGASEETPLQTSFDVADNTTAEFELYGRLFTTSEPIFANSITVERLSDEEISEKHTDAGFEEYEPGNTDGEKGYIFAEFDPNYDLTIEQAAELTGYDHFNWYQKIISDTDGRNEATYGVEAIYPWSDPNPNYKSADSYPYYWDENLGSSLYYGNPAFNLNGNFNFRDRPTVNHIVSGVVPGQADFKTYFVGVSKEDPYLSESLFNFEWSTTHRPDDPNVFGDQKITFPKSGSFGNGEVTLGNKEYTLGSHETSFYADDIFLIESVGGGFVDNLLPLPITPTPESTLITEL